MKKCRFKLELWLLFLLISVLLLPGLNAQNINVPADPEPHPVCATVAPDEKWEQWFQVKISQYKKDMAEGRVRASYTIPVIVHVLYNGNSEGNVGTGANLKVAQIQAQIDALNDALAGKAPGNSNLPNVFANVDADDIAISFCLALKDKNGNTLTEPGIDRIDWKAKGWSDPSTLQSNLISYFDGTIKPGTIWDPNKYCNIWVADFLSASGSGLIGYAKFPAGSTLNMGNITNADLGTNQNDGIVMASRCFGCKAKFANGYYSQDAYAYGITTVHEAGHWLGLRHISGDSECATDYCDDTPSQKGGNAGCSGGLNWGCPTHPFQAGQCSGNNDGEMFMDFMDYSNDGCRSLFTADQEIRMMTSMANGTYRKALGTHGLCNSVLTAGFKANKTSVCPGATVTFTDQTANGPATSWKWTFNGGNPSASTSQNPTVTYSAPGTYDVKLSVSDGSVSDSTTETAYIFVSSAEALPFNFGFESAAFPPTGWTLNNPDNKTTWARNSNVAKEATASMWFNSKDYDCNGCIDEITLPNVNLSSNSGVLTFEVAYQLLTDPAASQNWSDTLKVYLSTDCGDTWSQIYKKYSTDLTTVTPVFSSTAFVPTVSDWRLESINLPTSANAMIKFSVTSDYENNLYIDDIKITNTTSINEIKGEIGVLNIFPNPNNGNFTILFNAAEKETYTVEIKNVLGQIVFSEKLVDFNGAFSKQLNMPDSGNGIYLISISNSHGQLMKKIIID